MEGGKSSVARTETILDRARPTLQWVRSKWSVLWKVGVGLLCALVLAMVWSIARGCRRQREQKRRRQRAMPTCDLLLGNGETIFVSIPSYRDPDCSKTVVDLFQKARCPRRIFVGVCSQVHPTRDSSFMDSYRALVRRRKASDGPMLDNLRVLEIAHTEARGPMLARSLIETRLYRNEVYYLMIDSHTAFAQDWDVHCVSMLKSCPAGSRSVISTYPSDVSEASNEVSSKEADNPEPPFPKEMPSYLRFKAFNADSGQVELEGPQYASRPARPHPTAFWGACFSFGYGVPQIGSVPFDPHAHFVFLGEETSYAARLFTHGFEIYTPPAMVVHQKWSRAGRSTFWDLLSTEDPESVRRKTLEKQGLDRIKVILGMIRANDCARLPGTNHSPALKEIERYGLGSKRTLAQYQQASGIDFAYSKASGRARMGISAEATTEEIVSKYGSLSSFEIEKKRITGGR